jgi:hypothetical protein
MTRAEAKRITLGREPEKIKQHVDYLATVYGTSAVEEKYSAAERRDLEFLRAQVRKAEESSPTTFAEYVREHWTPKEDCY